MDIVVIAVRGPVWGRDGPTAIHRRAAKRLGWVGPVLARPRGIPSRACIRRRPRALKPAAFPKGFQDRIAHAVRTDGGGPDRLVALDGKTCRGSHDAAHGLGPLHIVSAWARAEGIAPGQVATEAESSGITAIPPLLEPIDLMSAPLTIDAMGCRKQIAHRIVAGGGDLVISVEGDRPTLREAIEAHLAKHPQRDLEDPRSRSHETSEAARGRIAERSYLLSGIPHGFTLKAGWPEIEAIGYASRVPRHADGRGTDGARFDILSRYPSGERFREAVRGHWGIESMHWAWGVHFREDDSRLRGRTRGNDLSGPRRFAVSPLKRHPVNDGLRGKMMRCLMSTEFLTEVLTLQRH